VDKGSLLGDDVAIQFQFAATPNGRIHSFIALSFKAILPHPNPVPSLTLNRLGLKQKHCSIQLNNIDF
jgi:hypothetical protein